MRACDTKRDDASTVFVDPPGAFESRRRLFTAIQDALEVRIVPRTESTEAVAAAAILFDRREATSEIPTIVLPSETPTMHDEAMPVTFASHPSIDRTLRGASLTHRQSTLDELPRAEDHEVLARTGRTPVWISSGNVERLAVGIAELGPSEPLRSRLASRSFLPLVSLVDFLRRATPRRFTLPALHASFVFDDPNLHSTRYGYLDYKRLAIEARQTGYHVAFATIPLDTWYASRGAVDLFRSHADVLSLLIHGNDHVRRELAQPLDGAGRRALLAQGLRRIERFEERYGIPVARVMAPPHGACSEAMAEEMAALGYDALCVSRPYPWRESPPPDRVLAGWGPTEIVGPGLPIIPRLHLDADRDEIVLRAFLRQPITLYGHHGDVRDGLDVLREAAGQVNAIGDVRWTSLREIVTSFYGTRVVGQRLHIRLHTRRASVSVPEGVSELVVEPSAGPPPERIVVDGQSADEFPVLVRAGRTVVVRLERPRPSDLAAIGAPRRRIWPYLRRGLAETRDMLLPVLPRR
jgi:hypothetical protein